LIVQCNSLPTLHLKFCSSNAFFIGVDFFKKNLSEWCRLESFPKSTNDSALFEDETFQKTIYNVWTFANKTNEVAHNGVNYVKYYVL